MPLMPALVRQKWEDLCEFEANLVYIVSSRTNRDNEDDKIYLAHFYVVYI